MSSPTRATPSISTAVRAVLRRAVEAYRDSPATATRLRDQIDRLDEPLRVAVAGKVKAGKSTLLNALVGEQIAPTDAGECTQVVTWYRDATSPRVT
ncbi:MAG: dynamin family protein, partial [Acidimicrobiales bacterium]